MANSKRDLFVKRRMRVRSKLRKVSAGRLRLSVHRSNKNISVQLIDDEAGVTLASASTLEPALGLVAKGNLEAAARIGATIAERAIAAAKHAFPAWSRSSPQERHDILKRIGDEIIARKDELGRLLSREEGKTLAEGIGALSDRIGRTCFALLPAAQALGVMTDAEPPALRGAA